MSHPIINLEKALIFIALLLGVKWIINPSGAYEPAISLCTTFIAGIDIWRRSRASNNGGEASIDSAEGHEASSYDDVVPEVPAFRHGNSCAFFAERFSLAFPGIREPKWFYGRQAIERLSILLDGPLKYSLPERAWIAPITWIRDGQNAIEQFKVIDGDTVLIETKELKIKRICACPMQNYRQIFVYVEAHGMPSTGLYPSVVDDYNKILEKYGYVWEEYGLFNGSHMITRQEHDDNAAIIMGRPVRLDGKSVVRTRYTSPYNMLICATGSSINQVEFDRRLEGYLNSILQGKDCIPDLIDSVKALPSSRAF